MFNYEYYDDIFFINNGCLESYGPAGFEALHVSNLMRPLIVITICLYKPPHKVEPPLMKRCQFVLEDIFFF